MMKKQFETLSQWKQRVHDANVMNREKFEQTRALITSLREENKELQKKIKEYDNREVGADKSSWLPKFYHHWHSKSTFAVT